MPTPEQAARPEGIHCLPLPTPFPVGPVNCYLIEGEPLTLVDCGPNWAPALSALEAGLAQRGFNIAQLELIVLSHEHVDHIGLAELLAERSGAEIAALAGLDRRLAEGSDGARAERRFIERVMAENGVPKEVALALRSGAASLHAFGSQPAVTRALAAGGELELADRRLRILHRPGHSPSDTLLFDAAAGVLLAGDHLLANISSNPILARPLGAPLDAEPERARALSQYLASLKQTAEMEPMRVLPGHGPVIEDHRELIRSRLALHERRAQKILRLLGPESLSAHEIAVRMWDKAAYTQAFLTLSEALGHLDVLVELDLIEALAAAPGAIRRYRAR